MMQSDSGIGETMKEALNKYSTATTFEAIWSKKQNKSGILGLRKLYAIPIIAIITCITLFTVGFASYQLIRKVDKTDYPFVNDQNVIGKWKSVDFVKDMMDFSPGVKIWKEELYLNELVFIKGGNMLNSTDNGKLSFAPTTWTKGKVINTQEKTASGYDIKTIGGRTYLFMQWKNGDYVFRGMQPYYYVLEKVDSIDYSNYKVTAIEDKIDYPFETDSQMIGKWESVDFVKDAVKFRPGLKNWLDDLYLTQIEISDNGMVRFITASGENSRAGITWTKGLIIDKNNKTASKCTIREIDGVTYMFYEWKSGDYSYRGMKPYYYVLRKAK